MELKICVALGLTISMVASAPVTNDEQDTIISYENNNDGTGNYKYSFQTAKGINKEEVGILVKEEEKSYITVIGSYSYFDPKGKQIKVSYTADQNGYHILVIPSAVKEVFSLPAGVVASLFG